MRFIILLFVLWTPTNFWGFHAHKLINRLAVFSLPPEMIGFFKENIDYITENAVNPDQRRYAVEGEAARHFIDFDNYPDSIKTKLPHLYWDDALTLVGENTLLENGTAPWQIQKMKFQLTEAFKLKKSAEILRIATDLGHYIADANVPLHTTGNYNGQLTNQVGIHAFWESRLPELYSNQYDYFVGKAEYENNVAKRSWQAVLNAHACLDSVFAFENQLTLEEEPDAKYTIEERNGITIRNYSRKFSHKYHEMLDNQVERQMRASIKMIADIWYTAWIDAGQPDLTYLPKVLPAEELKTNWLQKIFKVRSESDF